MVATSPRPDERSIGTYYQAPGYISHNQGNRSLLDRTYRLVRQWAIRNKLDMISTCQLQPVILDYGAGTGAFVQAALQRGWLATGVEPSEVARQNAITPLLPSLPADTTYSVITLWHVLEHVHNPNALLTELANRLTPQGMLVIAVPNRESFDAQHYRQHWAAYDVPRHLWHFSKENMARLLQRHSLKITAIKPMRWDSFYVSLLSERYRQTPSWLALLRAATIGMMSNLKAKRTNHSSLIYIIEK